MSTSSYSHKQNSAARLFTLDLMRSVAIVLMVVFHFIYDLKFFSVIKSDIPDGVGWQQFRWLIISLFFLCLGASLQLTHYQRFKAKKFFTRVLQIALSAAVISVGSYFFINENWIFFGVLHFLAVASLIAIFFVHVPKIAFVLGISVLVLGALQAVPTRWPFNVFFDNLPSYTNDYVAIIPWMGMVLIGVSLGSTRWFRNDPLKGWFSHSTKQLISTPGQHSLLIYLIHQPILMSAIYAVKWLSTAL
ncbi:MAG: heparan-alpha-glucosaminide N-acetyltransferase [Pseudomonadota bacterium]